MKIVLIDPHGFSDGLNTGLGYLSAVLDNYDVKIIDFNNKPGNEKRRLRIVKDADIIGISIKSYTLQDSLKTASLIKEINKNALLVAGGPHVTLDGYNFLKENPDFNVAILGEGEEVFPEIALGKNLQEIEGIIFRNDAIVINERRRWIDDLDRLPFPKYDNFDSVIADNNKIEPYPLVTSRGCPFSCIYCSVGNVIGKKWRARSPKNVINELIHAKEKYQSKEFRILDDNFTLDMKRVKDICQLLIDEKINLRWGCPNGIRADNLDEGLLKLMKESGCYSISFGIESGNEEVFDRINKGEKLGDIENAVRIAKKIGLEVNGFFIIGLPGSTYEKDKESMEFAKKLKLNSASFGILVPYPGTDVWEWINNDKNVKILMDWRKGFHIGFKPAPVFETNDYKAKEMLKAFYLANLKFMKSRSLLFILKTIINKFK